MIFLITCIFSFGNDWEFMSQGEHLIPLQISDMAIKKEKIEFKLRNDNFMDISVNFVFDSSSAGSRTIGFVTPPDMSIMMPIMLQVVQDMILKA